MTIEETLKEREEAYGNYGVHSRMSQDLKSVMKTSSEWNNLNVIQKESLEMIAHKIARILNKGRDIPDNWHDIAGYATLVENELKT